MRIHPVLAGLAAVIVAAVSVDIRKYLRKR